MQHELSEEDIRLIIAGEKQLSDDELSNLGPSSLHNLLLEYDKDLKDECIVPVNIESQLLKIVDKLYIRNNNLFEPEELSNPTLDAIGLGFLSKYENPKNCYCNKKRYKEIFIKVYPFMCQSAEVDWDKFNDELKLAFMEGFGIEEIISWFGFSDKFYYEFQLTLSSDLRQFTLEKLMDNEPSTGDVKSESGNLILDYLNHVGIPPINMIQRVFTALPDMNWMTYCIEKGVFQGLSRPQQKEIVESFIKTAKCPPIQIWHQMNIDQKACIAGSIIEKEERIVRLLGAIINIGHIDLADCIRYVESNEMCQLINNIEAKDQGLILVVENQRNYIEQSIKNLLKNQ